jgi:P pilus assembly chaperone PapD
MKAFLLFLSLCVCTPAFALTVSPMGQTLDASTATGSLRIQNNSKGAKRYQILADVVTIGADGQKVRTPTTDLVFYPASVVTLETGKIRTLRWKRSAVSTSQPQTYIVTVKEMPLDQADAVSIRPGASITYAPQMTFPWVFTPPNATPLLKARHEGNALVLINTGNGVAGLQHISYGGNPNPGSQIVLPGERLRLPAKASSNEVSFQLKGVMTTLPVE